MEPIFKVNVDSVISASKCGAYSIIKFLLEQGIIYDCRTEVPGSCSGCVFLKHYGCGCWAYCNTNIIYKWNKLSEKYVGEIEN